MGRLNERRPNSELQIKYSMGKSKYYVYWRGKEVGLTESWDQADRLTKRVFNGRFRSFSDQMEAIAFLREELEKIGQKLPAKYENGGWPALW